MTDLDLSRITNPLRLAQGSHGAGSGKGCAMNVISYINGDTKITDYPSCSARPLASLVQMVNDNLAGPDGFLSPENAVIALDLGWRTVGTAGVSDSVIHEWMAEMLTSPVWGAIRAADKDGAVVIERIAEMHRKVAKGEMESAWSAARSAAGSAAWSAAESAAESAAWSAAWSAAESAAWSAAWSAAESAAESAARSAAWSAAESAAESAALIEFTNHAIDAWRRISGLDEKPVDTNAVDTALGQMQAVRA
ncbi:hypothetical protein [Speluncibacter jeojiensis]|uniref:hypothetical protein n=1 Tax=Speluncibacter jeojiensis TaxID=2710754 RepID=UPI00240EE81C|nr:hypothetical protein [Rhodococcus sp. D2-41]